MEGQRDQKINQKENKMYDNAYPYDEELIQMIANHQTNSSWRNLEEGSAVILAVAVVLGVRRSLRKRHYISHASDA